MARKRKVPETETLYIYADPKAAAFAKTQAKKQQTPGGVSGWVSNLIIARMQKKGVKKEAARAGDAK